jgi:outer membrane protein OmpA-like peptidoglycan-associated protein
MRCPVVIHFDFNKGTLRPDSEAALQQIVGLVQANPSLSVEIQGHTDNVGGDASNQQLSEARAAAVQAWLTQHGIGASRLTLARLRKDSPGGEQRRRRGAGEEPRVEIAKANCK